MQGNFLHLKKILSFVLHLQINEEASDKVLEIEQKYNEIRNPIYDKRNDIIKGIPDFWLTAVSDLSSASIWKLINYLPVLCFF